MKHWMIFCVTVSAMVVTLCGCRSTQYIDRVVTKTVNHTDTMQLCDSVYVDRFIQVFQKGDTIYKVENNTQYKYKYLYKSKTDTLRQDSIVVQTKVKEVEKKMSWWQRTQMIIGDSFLVLFLVMIIFGITKTIKTKL